MSIWKLDLLNHGQVDCVETEPWFLTDDMLAKGRYLAYMRLYMMVEYRHRFTMHSINKMAAKYLRICTEYKRRLWIDANTTRCPLERAVGLELYRCVEEW